MSIPRSSRKQRKLTGEPHELDSSQDPELRGVVELTLSLPEGARIGRKVQITPEQNQRLSALIRSRLPLLFRSCPGCGQIDWAFNDKIWDLEELSGQLVNGLRNVYPIVVLECQRCSFVHLIAAKAAGILSPNGELNLG